MGKDDIRWVQRFNNFKKAFALLDQAVRLTNERKLDDLEMQGLIQRFEFTHELAWNVLKDYFADQGNNSITGSRDAIREAFSRGLIIDGEHWMDMIRSRNQSSHTYHEEVAADIAQKVCSIYHPLFNKFKIKMETIITKL